MRPETRELMLRGYGIGTQFSDRTTDPSLIRRKVRIVKHLGEGKARWKLTGEEKDEIERVLQSYGIRWFYFVTKGLYEGFLIYRAPRLERKAS